MWEKSKETTQCDKRTVICDIGTTQCVDRIVKFEKKKSKGTAKLEKKTITCDVETTQCKDRTVKCEKRVREPLNVKKNGYMWCWNCTMWGWNCQVWKKSKGTA